MTSKVIIRIGEESEHVERESLKKCENYTYAKNESVVFANVDIYYVILTHPVHVDEVLQRLREETTEGVYQANEYVRGLIRLYIEDNFEEFTRRVEKSIKTAHGVGIKKASRGKGGSTNARYHRPPTHKSATVA